MVARKVAIALVLVALFVASISVMPVVGALSAPSLSSPSNGATEQPTTPTLSWSLVSGALSYQLQVSTSSGFSTTVVDATPPLLTSYTVGVLESSLSQSTTYYWRVRAKDILGNPGSWSSTWSFTTSGPTLSAPTLSSPSNGATGASTTPTFSWSSVSSAISYQLQVSTSSNFSTTAVDVTPPLLTSYPVLQALSQSTTYYWRVRAKDILGNPGSWSSTWSFTTATVEALTISNVQVNVTSLISATVTWTTNKSSIGTVYYGISKTLATIPAVSLSTGTSHSATLVLSPGITYYFMVKAWVGLTEITATESATDNNNGSYFTFTTSGIGRVVKEGAAFKLPETIENKITSYTQAIPQSIRDYLYRLLPIQIPTTGFLLATQDSVSLVLSTSSDKGRATVEGWELPSLIDLGFSLSVILADNVSFMKDGQSVSLQQILANPSQYNLQLVKVSAMRRQVSILFDLGQIKVPLTVGYLTDNPQSFTQLVRGAIDRGKDFIQNPDPSFVKSLLGLEEARVGVFDFETDYWTDAQAETNGIVLSPGSVIQTLKSIFPDASNLMQLDQNIPVIYNVKTEPSYISVSSVEEITSNLAQYKDKVVGLTVDEFGGRLSIQEAIKSAIGVPIPVDVCVEGSVNWDNLGILPEMNQILLAIGASNDSQDQIADQFNGRYFVVGRIVTTTQIDESWPEYPLLLIYKKERVGDISWSSLEGQVKTFIENELSKLNWTLSSFSAGPISGITAAPPEGVSVLENISQIPGTISVPEKIEFLLKKATPGTPIELNLENTEVSKIMVRLRQTVENASISFKKITREEVNVPSPPENLFSEIYSYFEVSFKASIENAVDEAKISFSIPKEWLENIGASKDDVKLLRYHDGVWENLLTNVVGENQTHFTYTAEVPGFSVFSVTVYKPTVTEEERPAAEGIDLKLVGVVIAILIGCAAGGLIAIKKRRLVSP